MKKSLFRCFLLSICLVYGFDAQGQHKREYNINAEVSEIPRTDYTTEANNFINFFRINASCANHTGWITFDEPVYEKLVAQQISWLEGEIKDNNVVEGEFIRVLRIFYGIDDNCQPRLIYFTDHAELRGDQDIVSDTFDFVRAADITDLPSNATVYIIVGGYFKEKKYFEVEHWVDSYRTLASVNRNGTFENYSAHSKNVKGITYPFQVISRFSTPSNGSVYFTHTEKHSVKDKFYKHDIEIANFAPNAFLTASDKPFATNLGSLCPVNCPFLRVQNRYVIHDTWFYGDKVKKKVRRGNIIHD